MVVNYHIRVYVCDIRADAYGSRRRTRGDGRAQVDEGCRGRGGAEEGKVPGVR